MSNIRLSQHFALYLPDGEPEMACRSGAVTPEPVIANLRRLAAELEKIRAAAHSPLKITSGYRSPAHNARTAGAARNSTHTRGLAADFRAIRGRYSDAHEFHELILAMIRRGEIPDGGVGYYPAGIQRERGRVHYDLGRPGRRWTD